jgi:hypothetical protein
MPDLFYWRISGLFPACTAAGQVKYDHPKVWPTSTPCSILTKNSLPDFATKSLADLYCWRIYGFFRPQLRDNYDRPNPCFPLPENLKELESRK